MSVTDARSRPVRAGFRQAVAFEWTKLRSVRSTMLTLAAVGVLLPVFAVIVAATGSLQPDDTILGASLTAAVPAQLVAAAFGALVMSGEYATGTIRTTLAAVPRRVTVLAAKGTVVATALFVLSLPSAALAFTLGSLLLDTDRYASGDPWPALVGVALMLSVSGVLGLAVGAALRRTAGAVAALVGALLLPSLLAPIFGDLQRWVVGASPASALQKLTQTSDAAPDAVGSLGGWPSLAAVAVATAAALAASAWLLCARDA